MGSVVAALMLSVLASNMWLGTKSAIVEHPTPNHSFLTKRLTISRIKPYWLGTRFDTLNQASAS